MKHTLRYASQGNDVIFLSQPAFADMILAKMSQSNFQEAQRNADTTVSTLANSYEFVPFNAQTKELPKVVTSVKMLCFILCC